MTESCRLITEEQYKEWKACERLNTELIEKIDKLEKTIYETFDGLKCKRCGEYHKRHFICPACGYDDTKPEEEV